MTHFLLYLKSVMPTAQWGDHENISIAALPSGERFLVAPASAWPLVLAVNKIKPFPVPITPILLQDKTMTTWPKGRYLVAEGRGLNWYESGIRRGKAKLPDDVRVEKCGEEECSECFYISAFGGHYSLPVNV